MNSFPTMTDKTNVSSDARGEKTRGPRKQIWQVRREENSRRWRNCTKSYRNYLLSLA